MPAEEVEGVERVESPPASWATRPQVEQSPRQAAELHQGAASSAPVARLAPAVQSRAASQEARATWLGAAPGSEEAEPPCTTAHRCAACVARSRYEATAPA